MTADIINKITMTLLNLFSAYSKWMNIFVHISITMTKIDWYVVDTPANGLHVLLSDNSLTYVKECKPYFILID